jgi:hypothetical protein
LGIVVIRGGFGDPVPSLEGKGKITFLNPALAMMRFQLLDKGSDWPLDW